MNEGVLTSWSRSLTLPSGRRRIRFVATSRRDHDNLYIDIWEISSTSKCHPTKIDSLHVRHEFNSDNHQISFSPASLRVAVASVNSTIIRDARNSNILLEASASRTLGSYTGHFSPDGNFFACTEKQGVHIWKATSEGYALWARFPLRFSATAGGAFAFSPDSGSVVGWGLGIMEVWKLDHSVNPQSSEQPWDFWNSHLVGFSTNGTHAAIGRASSRIVTVVDLRSGASEIVDEVDLGIVDIKMVDDTVFALGWMRVDIWNLTAGPYEEEERGVRRAGLVQSHKVVRMLNDRHAYAVYPRLLDDQCRTAVFIWATDMILFDADSGARLAYYSAPSRFRGLRFSPDGRQLWVSFVHTKEGDCSDEDDGSDVGEGDENGVEGDGSEVEGDGSEGEGDESEGEGDEGDEEGNMLCLVDEEPEEGLEIVKDEETGEISLVPLPGDARSPDYPWDSPEGYKIDGGAIQWVLDREGRRLLWLPPHWRTTNEKTWRWNGNFLALRKGMLPEPVIIRLSST